MPIESAERKKTWRVTSKVENLRRRLLEDAPNDIACLAFVRLSKRLDDRRTEPCPAQAPNLGRSSTAQRTATSSVCGPSPRAFYRGYIASSG